MRLGGIASGLDTEGLIAKLMAVEMRPVLLAQQRQKTVETARTTWKDVGSRLNNLLNRVKELKAGGAGLASGSTRVSDDAIIKATGGTGALPGSYQVVVKQLASAYKATSQEFDLGQPLNRSGAITLAMVIPGEKDADGQPVKRTVTVELQEGDNIDQVISRFNRARDAEGKALPISVSKIVTAEGKARIAFRANNTGVQSELEVVEGQALFDSFNFEISAGRDAELSIDGIDIRRSSNSISDALPGVTLELLKQTPADADPVTLNVVRDMEKATKTVQDLVDQYNSLVEFITSKSSYDQESDQGGPLLGDSTATRLLGYLRQNILDISVSGEFGMTSAVGLTGAKYSEGGNLRRLEFDKEKFQKALEANPQAVQELFDEVANKLQEAIEDYTKSTGVLKEKDKAFEAQLKTQKERIEAMESRLELRERNLRRQWEGLEKIMGRLNNQQAGLMSMLNNLAAQQQLR